MKLLLDQMVVLALALTMPLLLEAAAQPAVKAAQTKALLQIKAALAPKVVIKDGWKEGTDFCKWNDLGDNTYNTLHINCDDASGLVTEINTPAPSDDFSKALPRWTGRLDAVPAAAWAALAPSLTLLYLSNSAITGGLPAGLTALSQLQKLDLGYTALTGTLPDAWAAFKNLEELGLDNMLGLTGTLPASWGKLTQLNSLTLGANTDPTNGGKANARCNIGGTLPAEWVGMRLVDSISISHCKLTGTLPAAWGGMGFITALRLEDNQLSGTLPDAWKAMGAVFNKDNDCGGILIDLSANRLNGALPASWSAINFFLLDLRKNAFTGALPKSWLALQGPVKHASLCAESFSTRRIYLDRKGLTGSVPSSFLQP